MGSPSLGFAKQALIPFNTALALAVAATLTACASTQLTESGRLSSYAGLKPSSGLLTKSKMRIEKAVILSSRSARLLPTVVSDTAAASNLTPPQLKLVANAVDRALCRNLSRRFAMIESGAPADINVQVVITQITKTDKAMAGASVVTGVATKVVGAVNLVPVPSLRLPFGLGSLSVEAEARTESGQQQVAAMIWARGADALTTNPRVADEGDAHTLAGEFAADFAKLLITGDDPIANPAPLLPTGETIGEYFGAAPKQSACRQFGQHPGLADSLGSTLGLPPDWTDKGAGKP